MDKLLLGLVLFFGAHSISIMAPDWRNRIAGTHELAWKAGYALISLAGIILMAKGYAEARLSSTLLYLPPMGLRHLAAFLMLPVFILFFAPYLPGRIKTVTRHPQLIAVKLWAFSHLLVNGTVADLLLFGSFLAWAVVDRISLKRRTPRAVPSAPPSPVNDVILVIVGLTSYVIFALYGHRWLIGVAPFG